MTSSKPVTEIFKAQKYLIELGCPPDKNRLNSNPFVGIYQSQDNQGLVALIGERMPHGRYGFAGSENENSQEIARTWSLYELQLLTNSSEKYIESKKINGKVSEHKYEALKALQKAILDVKEGRKSIKDFPIVNDTAVKAARLSANPDGNTDGHLRRSEYKSSVSDYNVVYPSSNWTGLSFNGIAQPTIEVN